MHKPIEGGQNHRERRVLSAENQPINILKFRCFKNNGGKTAQRGTRDFYLFFFALAESAVISGVVNLAYFAAEPSYFRLLSAVKFRDIGFDVD